MDDVFQLNKVLFSPQDIQELHNQVHVFPFKLNVLAQYTLLKFIMFGYLKLLPLIGKLQRVVDIFTLVCPDIPRK
jgi:hypothetical protein